MTFTRIVALGSSFAAGPGIQPVADRLAMRSERNYAHLVAADLGASLVDATVVGATTSTILDTGQRVLWHRFPPQIESVHPAADLVTITAVGNDLGYIGGVQRAAVLGRLGRVRMCGALVRRIGTAHPRPSLTRERIEEATDRLVRIAKAVIERAPRARVVLVDYVPIFTARTIPGPAVPFEPTEIEHFRDMAGVVSSVFGDAGRRSGADVLPASVYGEDHGLGAAEPWVASPRFVRPFSAFHPTPAGMRAIADALVAHLAASSGRPAR